MEDEQVKLCELLNLHLKDKGVSQAQLADTTDYSRPYISRLLKNGRTITQEPLTKFCNVLELTENQKDELFALAGYGYRDHTYIVEHQKTNLRDSRNIAESAWELGNIAIHYKNNSALFALWEIMERSSDSDEVIKECAYNIGRVVWEPLNMAMDNACFELFEKSIKTKSPKLFDAFSYVVYCVVIYTEKPVTKSRAKQFIDKQIMHSNPLIRKRYSYVRSRLNKEHGETFTQ